MKNTLRFTTLASLCLTGFALFSCSSDDGAPYTIAPPQKEIPVESSDLKLAGEYNGDRSKLISVIPNLEKFNSPAVTWKVIGYNDIAKDSIISEEHELYFVSLKEGRYNFIVKVQDDKNLITHGFDIKVEKEKEAYKSHISKVFDFLPSYGQFTNDLPKFEVGDTKETMIQKVEERLAKEKPGMITLGGYGGYVEFGFDHTIANVPGKRDFRVLGNAFKNSSEPGVIMVAFDKNGNGKPDEDEWYEIAGSEHNNPKTIKNYEITFFKPTKELDDAEGNIEKYVRWKDNQGNEGWKPKNSFHKQSYYPQWINAESITFKGTLLPNNAVDSNGQGNRWELKEFEWGYADNLPNNHDDSAIDISWAVDKDGKKVHLPGVDFIKVYTGLNQEAGWLGETSTEVSGAIDLHLEGTSIPTR